MQERPTKSRIGLSGIRGGLPIDIGDLIHARSVEDSRREFKGTWDKFTRAAVVKTVCAFANDLLNLNGGYVVLGIDTNKNGRPVLPPRGLDQADVDLIQREVRGQCNRIDPDYQPLLFPELYDDRLILVIWAPAGDTRPYQAPKSHTEKTRLHYVRHGSETVEAKGALRSQLFEQAAKVPFDDRRSAYVGADRISERLVRELLADIGSDIGRGTHFDAENVYANMRLVSPLNAHQSPRNIALLFFTDDPDQIFPGARIEVVQFADGESGDLIEERTIRGPLNHQIKRALTHLDSLGSTLFEKIPGRAEVDKTVTYPYEAMEEAVVNAVYHRSYENGEPTKVYMYPDRMEIISYPGPVQGIEIEHLAPGSTVPPVPARNRRIGELLKELRLAEARGTGLPKIRRRMSESGSPEPRFDFDRGRTYFRVVLPAHPRYRILHALRESALLWATGDRGRAMDGLLRTAEDQPGSGAVAGQIIEYAAAVDDLDLARNIIDRFAEAHDKTEPSQPFLRYAEAMLNRGRNDEARQWLSLIPDTSVYADRVDAAILTKRAGNYREAHRMFDGIYSQAVDDAKVIAEFAQTKIALATRNRELATKKRLNGQAAELLRRAIQLTDDPTRKAWAWFHLAGTLNWLREPETDVEQAYLEAISLRPDVERFREGHRWWKAAPRRRGRRG